MLQDNSTNLPHLIGFRMAIVVLQSDSLGDAVPSEYVMASPYPLGETQTPEQTTQAIEAALLHDSTAARVGALFQLLVQDTTAQDFGLPSSAIRLRM